MDSADKQRMQTYGGSASRGNALYIVSNFRARCLLKISVLDGNSIGSLFDSSTSPKGGGRANDSRDGK